LPLPTRQQGQQTRQAAAMDEFAWDLLLSEKRN
jgi:hypothetical protein